MFWGSFGAGVFRIPWAACLAKAERSGGGLGPMRSAPLSTRTPRALRTGGLGAEHATSRQSREHLIDSEGDQGGSLNPQFIAKDFKTSIRICGMTHVRTSPYYPQSNGRLERWHESLKTECIRPGTPLSVEDAKRLVAKYVERYNTVRLHGAIGYVTPADKLEAREPTIHPERDRKLNEARERRRAMRQATRATAVA